MLSGNKLWDIIEAKQQRYNCLGLDEMKDYKKFYIYSIIAHSTAIEGSTLTEKDTQLLFDEGIVVKGKSITEHLMNLDLKGAYEYAVSEAAKKKKITPDFLKQLNSLIVKNTGGLHHVAAGTFDSSKGDYRLCGVTAGVEGKSYMNYMKVPDTVNRFCEETNERLNAKNLKEIYHLSFDAHFNLVTIHPWVDGNGRTSRLLMNYIQFYHDVVPTKIHKEDKSEYIDALEKSRESETVTPFRNFMAHQHLKTLRQAIDNYEKSQKQADGFTLLF
jgi:Fic family protein